MYTKKEKPLTHEELNVVLPILIKVLKKTSPLKTLKAPEIVKGMNGLREKHGLFKVNFTESLLRKLSNHIRGHEILPLIADSKGYYISSNIDDLELQEQSMIDRIEGIRFALNGIQNMKKALILEQKSDPFGITDWR